MKDAIIVILLLIIAYLVWRPESAYQLNHRISHQPTFRTTEAIPAYHSPLEEPPRRVNFRH